MTIFLAVLGTLILLALVVGIVVIDRRLREEGAAIRKFHNEPLDPFVMPPQTSPYPIARYPAPHPKYAQPPENRRSTERALSVSYPSHERE